jgi:hypothetical protein
MQIRDRKIVIITDRASVLRYAKGGPLPQERHAPPIRARDGVFPCQGLPSLTWGDHLPYTPISQHYFFILTQKYISIGEDGTQGGTHLLLPPPWFLLSLLSSWNSRKIFFFALATNILPQGCKRLTVCEWAMPCHNSTCF